MRHDRPMNHDYREFASAEIKDISDLLHSFEPAQWDKPTLCAGWNVRHVIGHMCMGSTMNPLALPIKIAPYKFNVARASSEESFKYGEEHTPAEMLDTFDRVVVGQRKPGLAKVAAAHEWFVDKLIHNQDIRRPQGLGRDIPRERLVAAMDALPRIGSFLQSKRVCKGLRFTATDIDHSVGE